MPTWCLSFSAATIRLALVGLEFGVIVPMRKRARGRGPALPLEVALYSIVSILGSYLAAYIVHATFFPGFLASPRSIAVTGMYAILFSTPDRRHRLRDAFLQGVDRAGT
jgi:hypothetical protein